MKRKSMGFSRRLVFHGIDSEFPVEAWLRSPSFVQSVIEEFNEVAMYEYFAVGHVTDSMLNRENDIGLGFVL